MSQDLIPGDFLVFQLESGYGLLRVLDVVPSEGTSIWHLAAYENLFLDTESAESAIQESAGLKVSHPHIALTERAFLSTQVAKLSYAELEPLDSAAYVAWQSDPDRAVLDRSVRLILGLR